MVSYCDADVDSDAVLCDFCSSEPAVVYCRADSARLCLSCDREVHAANTVSSGHSRSLLCDHCAAAPAAIFCPSPPHRLVLCSNCDFNAHQADNQRYDRHALDPFSGCPSGVFLAAALGVGDGKDTIPSQVEEDWDWETPHVFCWEDLILSPSTTPFHGYQAMGIPPPLKVSNSSCGKRKEEICRQIQQLIIGETAEVDDREEIEPIVESRLLPPENQVSFIQCNLNDNQMAVQNSAAASSQELKIGSSSLSNTTFTDSTMEAGSHVSLPPYEVPDRSSFISRYKEKRKARRYDKLIRYESRKTRADSRVRIKGRFAKANQVTNP
ncbi:Zinc finger protein CONSTANS-LIKE 13 [Platanthera zijinensis]|uniref:Zinc finger protein CONSTANS-LIKE 13 n=1 Tax=Platanthera zijinensis TaxID=2320716 RepID=A0AAP0GCF3_9ASPA